MTIFSRHISVMRRVCVQTTGISSLPATTSSLSGTPSPRLRRGSGNSVFELVLGVSQSVCGFFHLCLHFFLFVCLCGRSHLEAGGYRPSLRVKRLPRSLVSAAFCFSPSGQQPGLRWRLELLLAWLTKYVPVGTGKASNTGALRGKEARQKTTNLLSSPWGERQVSVTEMSLRKQNTQRL